MSFPGTLRPRSGAWPLALLVLGLVLSATTLYMLNEDLWWYLACGRAILDEGGVPGRELFLYPIEGEPLWLWHSWGWTVLLAQLERWGGLDLALALGSLFAGALVWRVFTSARLDRYGLLNATLVLLVVWVAGRRLSHKSELASWCLFAFYVCALDGRAQLRWRAAVVLALTTLIWSNLHGGYLLAYAVLGAFAIDKLASPGEGSRRARLRRALAATSPTPWLVLALTGILLASPTATILRDHLPLVLNTAAERGPQDLILEYERTFSEALPPLMKADVRTKYVLFLVLGLLGFVCTRAPRSVFRMLLFVGMATLGHRSVRFVHGFAIASVLVTMANLAHPAGWVLRIGDRFRGRVSAGLHLLAGVLAAALILTACAGEWVNRRLLEVGQSRQQLVTTDPGTCCPGAAAFLLEADLDGRIFNDMLLGGDLVQRLWPRHRLFIDSRNMSYDLLREYLTLCSDDGEWRAAVQRYDFRTVVLSNLGLPGPIQLLRERLVADDAWKLTYLDPQAAVFRRAPGETLVPRISALSVDGLDGHAPFVRPASGAIPGLVERLGRLATLDARPFLYRYLIVLGELGEAAARWEVCTAALTVRPSDSWLRARRAEVSFDTRRFLQSIEDLDWLLARPEHGYPVAELMLLRARCYAALDRIEEALADLRALRTIEPNLPAARKLRRELRRRAR